VQWSPGCAKDTLDYLDRAIAAGPVDAVLWSSTWELADYDVDGKTLDYGTPAFDRWLFTQFDAAREKADAAGARLVFLTIPDRAPNPLRDVTALENKRVAHMNRLYADYAAQHPDTVAVADLGAIVCPSGTPCPATVDGITLRPKDGGHFEADGAAWVAPRLMDELFRTLRTLDEHAKATTGTTTPR
jgi:hypothetical protein